MEISQSSAMRIVTELKKVINYDITFMDMTCHILACTNEKRIGDFHEASWKMLSEGLLELVVPTSDTFRGTGPGVNMRLTFQGETVGVVGITGEYTQLHQYGHIIQKMTEILLLEEYLKDQQYKQLHSQSRFVQEWLSLSDAQPLDRLVRDGSAIGVDVFTPRQAVVLLPRRAKAANDEDSLNASEMIKAEQFLRTHLCDHIGDLLTANGDLFLFLCKKRTNEHLLALLKGTAAEVLSQLNITLSMGVDSQLFSGIGLRQSVSRAKKAARAALTRPSGGVAFYDDILMEILLGDISDVSRTEYVKRIFRGLNKEEIQQYAHILTTLYQCDGSLTRAAEQLFIHKNTLQYRLNRLAEKTGYNPRKLTDLPLFAIGIALCKETRE